MKKLFYPCYLFITLCIFQSCSLEEVHTTSESDCGGVIQADFTFEAFNCKAPCSVQFENTSTNASAFNWDFGDGNTSNQINPNHTFTLPGTYTVRLTIQSDNCEHFIEKNVIVEFQTFTLRVGGNVDDRAYSVCQTFDGNYVVSGSMGGNITLLKIQEDGQILWQKDDYGSGVAYSIAETNTGSILVGGGSNSQFIVLEVDDEGAPGQSRTYGGDNVREIIYLNQSDKFVAVGDYVSVGGVRDIYCLKSGNLNDNNDFKDRYGEEDAAEYGCGVAPSQNGSFVVAGYFIQDSQVDIYLMELNENGTKIKERIIEKEHAELGYAIQATSDNGFIIAGELLIQTGGGGFKCIVIKIDSDFNIVWEKTYEGLGWARALDMKTTADGGYILAGQTGVDNLDKALLIKLDANGDLEWERSYGGLEDDSAWGVIQTNDGGYMFVGGSSTGTGLDDFLIVKTDDQGNID